MDDTDAPYYLNFKDDDTGLWVDEEDLRVLSDNLSPRPKVKQAVLDWYFKFQENNWDVESYLVDEPKPSEVDKWLYTGNRQLNSERQHALATLITYGPTAVEVEKEKRYEVRIKNDVVFSRNLVYDSQVRTFEFSAVRDRDAYQFTKQELIDAGFEGVFDNEMFEVEEV